MDPSRLTQKITIKKTSKNSISILILYLVIINYNKHDESQRKSKLKV